MAHVIPVLALGSTGDVLPLLVLVAAFLGGHEKSDVVFAFGTNAAHANLCARLLRSFPAHFRFIPIDLPPVAIHSEKEGEEAALASREAFFSKAFVAPFLRRCATAANNSAAAVCKKSDDGDEGEDEEGQFKPLLVLCNLFALEGWVVSSVYAVPCVIVHPCQPHLPDGGTELRDELLRQWKTREPETALLRGCWEDHYRWLWPTLTEDFQDLRESLQMQRLGNSFSRSTLCVGGLQPLVLLTASPALLGGDSAFGAHVTGLVMDHDFFFSTDADHPEPVMPESQSLPQPSLDAAAHREPNSEPESEDRGGSKKEEENEEVNEGANEGKKRGSRSSSTNHEEEMKPSINATLPPFPSPPFSATTTFTTASAPSEVFVWVEEQRRLLRRVVCVDFGSMTPVLSLMRDLCPFLGALRQEESFSFVLLCHDQLAAFAGALRAVVVVAATATSITAPATSTASASAHFLLASCSVAHAQLVTHVVTVLHHGGVGTSGTCLRLGLAQLPCPVVYDQQHWAGRLVELGVAPCVLPADLLFPVMASASTSVSASLALRRAIAACAPILKQALASSSAPALRLRAGTLGRQLRGDAAEDGLRNALPLLREAIQAAVRRAEKGKEEEAEMEMEMEMETEMELEEQQKQTQQPEPALTRFSNGLQLYCHASAPEETAFLFEEVFERLLYFRNGVSLADGDLVVDIGANVGMFAVCAELLFSRPRSLRLVCVEAAPKNFTLLQLNLQRFCPSAKALLCAVGVGIGVGSESCPGQGAGTRETELLFFGRIPGNSCLRTLAARNAQQRRRYMNPSVQIYEDESRGGGGGGGESVMCPVRTLGEVIAIATAASPFAAGDARAEEQGSASRPQVALLKIDVEGAELAALQVGAGSFIRPVSLALATLATRFF